MRNRSNAIQYMLTALIGLFYVTCFEACKKDGWYDIKSDVQLSIPRTLKDMQALLDNGNVFNTFSPSMGEIASDGHYVSNSRAATLSGYNWNAYTWSHERRNENVADWINGNASGSYKRIYYANVIIDGLGKISLQGVSEQAELNNIKGQAYFHRARTFYELSQIFAPPYEAATANAKLGIPLRLESDIEIPTTRSSLKATYDQIFSDLDIARNLLPEKAQFATRPSRLAVYALLARIYLSMEEYVKAGEYADSCLDIHRTLIDFSTLDSNITSNPIIGYNSEILFYTQMGALTPISFANLLIDKNLYNLYENADLRRKIFFNKNPSTDLITYKGTYSSRGFNTCFAGLATDELYLIRAEASARAGNAAAAMDDLNTLLRKRFSGTYIDLTATDAEDALFKVLTERKKELLLRGLRWSDLRRLNRDNRFKVTISRTVSGVNYSIEPDSYKYTFPIPDDIIAATGMVQNTGW